MSDEHTQYPRTWRFFLGYDKDGAAVDACGALDVELVSENGLYLERDEPYQREAA